jgi:hypothetical protein
MNEITKPKHYTQGKVECLDAIDAMLEDIEDNFYNLIWRYYVQRVRY